MQQLSEEAQILEECREKARKGQACYKNALSLESIDPIQAVNFLCQAYLTSSHHLSRLRLITELPADITQPYPPENLHLGESFELMFYRGLQSLTAVGKQRSYQIALAYFDYVIQEGIAKNDTAFVPHALLWRGLLYLRGLGVQKDPTEGAKCYRRAADFGFAKAQRNLGGCYAEGVGVQKDEAEAVIWFRKAALQGFAEAQFNLGSCYNKGLGVPKDPLEAVKWFRRAAEQGLVEAQVDLGVCYELGIGVQEDLTEAVKWNREAAEQGFDVAQCNLGFCYENGHGIKKNPTEAVKWYRRAAEQGNGRALCNLGVCYENGFGVVKNDVEMVKCYRKAAEQGFARAQSDLGVCYEFGTGVSKDPAEAANWYTKAAAQGFACAECNLGECYENGFGVSKDDMAALYWYRKAAEQGFARAECNLGYCYRNGIGVTQDDTEAAKWYQKAAQQGFARAQCNVGWCFEKGRGVPQDSIEALEWYRKSAKQGYARGQFNLGWCYALGVGVPINKVKAVKWLRRAAKQNYDNAQKRLNEMYHSDEVVFDHGHLEDYFNDALSLNCDGACEYLVRASEQDPRSLLATHFYFKLQYCQQCNENPSDFFEMLQQDPYFFGEWMLEYLFIHGFEKLAAHQQIDLSAYFLDRGTITDQAAKRVIGVLEKIEQTENADRMKKLAKILHLLTIQLEGENSEKAAKSSELCHSGLFQEQPVAAEALEASQKKLKTGTPSDTGLFAETTLIGDEEKILADCREKAKKGQELYEKALAQKTSNSIEAVKLFHQAHMTSSHILASAHLSIPPTITEPDPAEKLNLDGTLEDIFYRGLQSLTGIGVKHSFRTALAYLNHAIEHPYAQFWKGFLYLFGCGVQKDAGEAVEWFLKAANQDFAMAQILLGNCYEKGQGIQKDEFEACRWYRKAAEQGFAAAQTLLGDCYAQERGIQKDEIEAVKWLRRAAEQGYGKAQYMLAHAYIKGVGVQKDIVESENWLRKAAKQKFANAREQLNTFYLHNKVVYNSLFCQDYFNDGLQLECEAVRDYLLRVSEQKTNSKIILAAHVAHKLFYCHYCKENPSGFFEMMQKDPDFFGEWMYHFVFHKFLQQLTPEQQIELSSRYYYAGPLTDNLAKKIIAVLEKIESVADPELKIKHADMLHFLTIQIESDNSEKAKKYRELHDSALFPQELIAQMEVPEILQKKQKLNNDGQSADEEWADNNNRVMQL